VPRHETGRTGYGTDETLPGGVTIRRKEIDRTAEKQALLDRIAREKEQMLNAKRDAQDQEKLLSESEAAITNLMQNLQVDNLSTHQREKERWMQEERRLEEERARAHQRAVEAEHLRAKAKAEKISMERSLAHTKELMERHRFGVQNARELARAHEIALESLEANRARLEEKEYEIEVIGQRLPVDIPPMNIEVPVVAEEVPEVRRMAAPSAPGGVLRTRIEEQLPHRERVHVPAEQAVSGVRTREQLERVEVPYTRSKFPVEVVERAGETPVEPLPTSGFTERVSVPPAVTGRPATEVLPPHLAPEQKLSHEPPTEVRRIINPSERL
jgi:hypothetical protein